MKTVIQPVLSVRNVVSAIDFYKRAFGAVELKHISDPDGAVVAEMSIDDAFFFLADESPVNANYSPETIGGNSVRMAITFDDPDALFAKAIAAGALEIYPVADQEYGYRLGRLSDPVGHRWEIGKLI